MEAGWGVAAGRLADPLAEVAGAGSPDGRQNFLSQLPFLLVFLLGGGLAAIALGAVTAVVGGRIVIFLANLRRKSVR